MKKFSTFLLALIACAGTMFADGIKIGDLYYNLNANNKTAEVTYQEQWSLTNYPYQMAVNIPESVDYNSETYIVTSIGSNAFFDCTGLTSIEIPNSVTSIGNYAFRYCSGLTSITIPNSVTSIGEGAFSECSGLTSLTIPNSVTSIGSYAFDGCSGLTSPVYNAHVFAYMPTSFAGEYSIPDGIELIAGGAFYRCTGLTSVTIGNSVTSIGDQAFYGCSNLTSVTIGNSVTSIGADAFAYCSGLTSVTIPNSVTSIGYAAFYECTGLTSPVYNAHVFAYMPTSFAGEYSIPDGIELIAGYAFDECSGLTSITIPNSVTSIGGAAFRGCSGLTSIYNYATTPQSIESEVFEGVDKSKCKLYVPKGSVNTYNATDGWTDFKNIQAIDNEDIDQIQLNSTVKNHKILYNGKFYILTGNKTYTVTGQQLK